MSNFFDKSRFATLCLGIAIGVLLLFGMQQLSYCDFRRVASPVDMSSLTLRCDAKGNGRFGAPRSGNRKHRGIDIESPVGTPVCSIKSGKVIQVGKHKGLGWFIEIQHAHKISSLYAHLESVNVSVGDRLRQGQKIGAVGKTGNAKSPLIKPHLHLEIWKNGEPVDPETMGVSVIKIETPKGGPNSISG
jgi:murein DD-endopeptidase MepM/ murein hydrolase activator NlpD